MPCWPLLPRGHRDDVDDVRIPDALIACIRNAEPGGTADDAASWPKERR
jgi:hypothetical protein